MYHFCTYFNKHYLLRGLALFRSLQRHCDDFRLHVLCLDQETYSTLETLAQDRLRPLPLTQLEQAEPRLLSAKANRRPIEYFFTLTPHLPRYLFDLHPAPDLVTYLDADLLFFSSPAPLFEELGDAPLLYFEHRFPPALKKNEKFGRFNVQYLSFRNNEDGRACLDRWGAQCRDWCYDRLENDRFADQKYLDQWPRLYPNGVIAEHPGAGVGPWNWATSRLTVDGQSILADGRPLIFYHYHALKILGEHWVSLGMARYGRMPEALAGPIYGAYLDELRASRRWLAGHGIELPLADRAVLRIGHNMLRTLTSALLRRQLMRVA